MEKLLEQRKEIFKDKVLVNGCMVLTESAKKRLYEIDKEIGRNRDENNNG